MATNMIPVDGVMTDVSKWPTAAVDAVVKANCERDEAQAQALKRRDTAERFAVGPSGTLVMTGVSSRGLALYGGQWRKVIAAVLDGRIDAALVANERHLASRDANGRNIPPADPLANYGKTGSLDAKEPEPSTLAERAAANAAATMAARDAAEAAK